MDTDVNTNAEVLPAGSSSSIDQSANTGANGTTSDDIDIDAMFKAFGQEEIEEETHETEAVEPKVEANVEEKPAEEPEHPEAEARKERLNREIRDTAAELSRLKEEVSNYKELQLPTVEEMTQYIMTQDEDISESEANIEARLRLAEAQNQRQSQIQTIAETRQEQITATEKARQEYPELFDERNPLFSREVASGIMQMYEETAGVQRGSDGEVVKATIKLEPFLRTVGELYKIGMLHGQRSATKQAKNQTMRRNVASNNPYPSSTYQTTTSGDKELDAMLKGFITKE